MRAQALFGILMEILSHLFMPGSVRYNIGDNNFSVDGIRTAHRRDFMDCWMVNQRFFDLSWRNVFAATIDDLAQATFNEKIAILIHVP